MAKSVRIKILLKNQTISRYQIVDGKDSFVIGRSDRADVQIESDLISREHLKISFDQNNQLFIEDLNSSNGTWFNKQRIPTKEKLSYVLGEDIYLGMNDAVLIKIENSEANSKPQELEEEPPVLMAVNDGYAIPAKAKVTAGSKIDAKTEIRNILKLIPQEDLISIDNAKKAQDEIDLKMLELIQTEKNVNGRLVQVEQKYQDLLAKIAKEKEEFSQQKNGYDVLIKDEQQELEKTNQLKKESLLEAEKANQSKEVALLELEKANQLKEKVLFELEKANHVKEKELLKNEILTKETKELEKNYQDRFSKNEEKIKAFVQNYEKKELERIQLQTQGLISECDKLEVRRNELLKEINERTKKSEDEIKDLFTRAVERKDALEKKSEIEISAREKKSEEEINAREKRSEESIEIREEKSQEEIKSRVRKTDEEIVEKQNKANEDANAILKKSQEEIKQMYAISLEEIRLSRTKAELELEIKVNNNNNRCEELLEQAKAEELTIKDEMKQLRINEEANLEKIRQHNSIELKELDGKKQESMLDLAKLVEDRKKAIEVTQDTLKQMHAVANIEINDLKFKAKLQLEEMRMKVTMQINDMTADAEEKIRQSELVAQQELDEARRSTLEHLEELKHSEIAHIESQKKVALDDLRKVETELMKKARSI
jgi:pSer/pThr/pTyr-binding forkhead associated (FHA) protein